LTGKGGDSNKIRNQEAKANHLKNGGAKIGKLKCDMSSSISLDGNSN
jgi:hypothetical protein